jgi:transcription antitermination factor NusG
LADYTTSSADVADELPCAAVSPQWFAVYTASRHEKRVHQLLTEKQIESFLPLYRTTRHWKKRRQTAAEVPLFPNYLFVRIGRSARGTVLSVPGVLLIVGSGRDPSPLPDCEVDTMRTGILLNIVEPHSYLGTGERARITKGPFAGMTGVVLHIRNKVRVVLTIEHIKQSFAVEVAAEDLESVAEAVQ